MPRLKGRQSNTGLSVALLLVLIGTSIAVPLEYLGITDLITNFGKDEGTAQSGSGVTNKPIIAHDTIDKVEQIDR